MKARTAVGRGKKSPGSELRLGRMKKGKRQREWKGRPSTTTTTTKMCMACVLYTLKCYFHPFPPSTTSVRVDVPSLEKQALWSQTTRQSYTSQIQPASLVRLFGHATPNATDIYKTSVTSARRRREANLMRVYFRIARNKTRSHRGCL